MRAGGRRRHDLPGEGAADRDNDQLPVSGADREGTGVGLLKDAQDVGDRLAVTCCGRRQRMTTRWPTSAGVSRTSSRKRTPSPPRGLGHWRGWEGWPR